jgi:hypothetical protein
MEIAINGRFLTQRITGVQRYAHELVDAFDDLAGSNADFRIVVLSSRLSGAPPARAKPESSANARQRII